MSRLTSADVLLADAAAAALATLDSSSNPKDKAIARRARGYRSILLNDCLHGEVVRKSAIPRALRTKHLVENLYVEDLPDFWRLLYAVSRRNGKPYVVVIEIVDHKTYSRWFPGKGK